MKRRIFLGGSALAVGSLAVTRSSSAQDSAGGVFELPDLPYAADSLEPHIDAQTMSIHHGKHHAGYTRNLNDALAKLPELQGQPIESILARLGEVDDPALQSAVRNNGGGYYNHSLFWETMAPANETGKATSALNKAIERAFGSMKQFQQTFAQTASSRFGSGWAWLVVRGGELSVFSTPNQDNPLMMGIVDDKQSGTPILGVDVWEHAYYLKYQNRRGDYLNAWWNVVNWDRVSENFDRAA